MVLGFILVRGMLRCCTSLGQACSNGYPSSCSHYVISNSFCNLSYQQIFWHLCVLKGSQAFSLQLDQGFTSLYISYSTQDLHRDPAVQIHLPVCVGVQVETSLRLYKPHCYRRCRIPLQRVKDIPGWGFSPFRPWNLCCSREQCCLVPFTQQPWQPTPLVLHLGTELMDQAAALLLEPVLPCGDK